MSGYHRRTLATQMRVRRRSLRCVAMYTRSIFDIRRRYGRCSATRFRKPASSENGERSIAASAAAWFGFGFARIRRTAAPQAVLPASQRLSLAELRHNDGVLRYRAREQRHQSGRLRLDHHEAESLPADVFRHLLDARENEYIRASHQGDRVVAPAEDAHAVRKSSLLRAVAKFLLQRTRTREHRVHALLGARDLGEHVQHEQRILVAHHAADEQQHARVVRQAENPTHGVHIRLRGLEQGCVYTIVENEVACRPAVHGRAGSSRAYNGRCRRFGSPREGRSGAWAREAERTSEGFRWARADRRCARARSFEECGGRRPQRGRRR